MFILKKFSYVMYITLLILVFSVSCQKKEAFKKELKSDGYKVVITSEQPPHVGINNWKIEIFDENGKAITDGKVSVNGYMPPMPGMPEMSFDYPVKKEGSYYISEVNLSMSGTWQITIKLETGDKIIPFKFGFNL